MAKTDNDIIQHAMTAVACAMANRTVDTTTLSEIIKEQSIEIVTTLLSPYNVNVARVYQDASDPSHESKASNLIKYIETVVENTIGSYARIWGYREEFLHPEYSTNAMDNASDFASLITGLAAFIFSFGKQHDFEEATKAAENAIRLDSYFGTARSANIEKKQDEDSPCHKKTMTCSEIYISTFTALNIKQVFTEYLVSRGFAADIQLKEESTIAAPAASDAFETAAPRPIPKPRPADTLPKKPAATPAAEVEVLSDKDTEHFYDTIDNNVEVALKRSADIKADDYSNDDRYAKAARTNASDEAERAAAPAPDATVQTTTKTVTFAPKVAVRLFAKPAPDADSDAPASASASATTADDYEIDFSEIDLTSATTAHAPASATTADDTELTADYDDTGSTFFATADDTELTGHYCDTGSTFFG